VNLKPALRTLSSFWGSPKDEEIWEELSLSHSMVACTLAIVVKEHRVDR
jgi:hypothetical protein